MQDCDTALQRRHAFLEPDEAVVGLAELHDLGAASSDPTQRSRARDLQLWEQARVPAGADRLADAMIVETADGRVRLHGADHAACLGKVNGGARPAADAPLWHSLAIPGVLHLRVPEC